MLSTIKTKIVIAGLDFVRVVLESFPRFVKVFFNNSIDFTEFVIGKVAIIRYKKIEEVQDLTIEDIKDWTVEDYILTRVDN